MRNPYQSPAIEQGMRQYMLLGTENLPGLIPYKQTSRLFQKDKVIRKCMVHYLNKDVPSSSELRKCLSLAFGKYYISIPRPQLRHNNLREYEILIVIFILLSAGLLNTKKTCQFYCVSKINLLLCIRQN